MLDKAAGFLWVVSLSNRFKHGMERTLQEARLSGCLSLTLEMRLAMPAAWLTFVLLVAFDPLLTPLSPYPFTLFPLYTPLATSGSTT